MRERDKAFVRFLSPFGGGCVGVGGKVVTSLPLAVGGETPEDRRDRDEKYMNRERTRWPSTEQSNVHPRAPYPPPVPPGPAAFGFVDARRGGRES